MTMQNTAIDAPKLSKSLMKKITKRHSEHFAQGEQVLAACQVSPIDAKIMNPIFMGFGALGALIGHALAGGPMKKRLAEVCQSAGVQSLDQVGLADMAVPTNGILSVTNQRLLLTNANGKKIEQQFGLEHVAELRVIGHDKGCSSMLVAFSNGARAGFVAESRGSKATDHFVATFGQMRPVHG